MEDRRALEILSRLSTAQADEAWPDFLEAYSPLILQVVRFLEHDADYAADCFLYACQELCRNDCRRLRRFQPGGAASFSTWLRAVVRNLCLDWHRGKFGRHRLFQSIARLSALDREVFRCAYERGWSPEEILVALRGRFSGLTDESLRESLERIRRSLSDRQRWLLLMRRPLFSSLEAGADPSESPRLQLADPRPDPESLAVSSEERQALRRGLQKLNDSERMLVRLRYEHGLTLEQVARATGLPDAQTADRRTREILERLRKTMT